LLFAATEPFAHLGEADPSLLLFRRDDFEFEGRFVLTGLRDVRGLCWWDGSLYVVSSGTGQIVAFPAPGRLLGADRFVWRPPIELGDPVALGLHSVTLHTCDYYATARGRGGLLLNHTRSALARQAEGKPGRLLSLDGRLLVANPEADRLDPEGPALPAGQAPLGLAELEGKLFLGGSTGDGVFSLNHLAPSGALIDHPVTPPIPSACFSDLIAVEEAGDWPDEPDLDWLDSHGQRI
jgi:hypothetical protein